MNYTITPALIARQMPAGRYACVFVSEEERAASIQKQALRGAFALFFFLSHHAGRHAEAAATRFIE
jgi:hypothetical protein